MRAVRRGVPEPAPLAQVRAGLGRFRLSATTDAGPAVARDFPAEVEELLMASPDRRTPEGRERLLRQFVAVSPELAKEREAIEYGAQHYVELTRACLKRVHACDRELHSFVLLTEERALADAREPDLSFED